MEQTRYANLPLIGRVQHGEQTVSGKGTRKVVELGHFIAKIQDSFMEVYLQKFNELYKGKKSIDIEFFDDNPLSMKYVRYNQSGEVCSRYVESNTAKQKVKNGWQDIKCDLANCPHRQKNEQGKMACNRVGWLKFLIPSICKDRIWLMRITGQNSIDRLDDYFSLQRAQGHSIKGHYTLFLTQKEQSNGLGQSFNNYVLDILKKEDFNSSKTIPQTTEKPNELSTTNAKTVNNTVVKTEKAETKVTAINQENKKQEENKSKTSTTKETNTTKQETNIKETSTPKKTTKSKAKKTEETELVTNPDMEKCYVLIGSHIEDIMKDGKPKKYFIGDFHDMSDNPVDIIIKPEFIDDLSECDLGTIVELNIQEFGGRKIAMDLKYVQKVLKNIAA